MHTLSLIPDLPRRPAQFLSSPEVEAIVHSCHGALAILGMPLSPLLPASAIIPAAPVARLAAMLHLSWLLLGWLLPALLLMPARPGAAGSGGGPALPAAVEAALRSLLPPKAAPAGQAGTLEPEIPPAVWCALRWWVVLEALWAASCVTGRVMTASLA
jgi:hypothetical protein